MFRRKVIILLVLFAIYLALVLLYMITLNTESYKEYRRLIDANSITPTDAPSEQTKQIRRLPEKNLWLTKDFQRLHLKLIADSSELFFAEQMWSSDVLEKMAQVRGWIQEELYYLLPDGREAILQPNGRLLIKKNDPNNPESWINRDFQGIQPMQRTRYIESQTALINYSSSTLSGDNVSFIAYEAPGHTLKEDFATSKIILRGIATSLEIKMEGENVGLKAGKIKLNFQDGSASLEAGILSWDQQTETLVLENNVHLESPTGIVTTDKKMTILTKKGELDSIESTGSTHFTYLAGDGIPSILQCQGTVFINHRQNRIDMRSPPTPSPSPRELQVFFQDDFGEMFANQLTLWYEKNPQTHHFSPSRILVQGDVQLENHSPLNPAMANQQIEQYALADEIELFPESKKIILKSSSPSRSVLFFDKANDLQMSAHEVEGSRDLATGEDRVRGKGKVRLSFIDEELETLHLRFPNAMR